MFVQFDTSICATDCSDHALIVATLAGDECAFPTLVQRYQLPLYNFIQRSLRETEWANDVLQFVFLQLYTSLPRLRDTLYSEHTNAPLKAWLFQVAWNRCIDERRKQRSLLFSELEENDERDEFSFISIIPDGDPQPDIIAEQQELRVVLRKAIRHLPSHFRSVVMLRYTQELSFGEIGRLLNMPENTAKTYFQRARPLLRSALQRAI
ncbi:RNA polymerase sigma factor [Dictyobacter kobayashii]|uniref:RNA polymerase sigma factor n=1 Tax=Dictyobacter kobayashii TaxID=2014872 RepID=A0A402AL05_9CHLR|nr:sigma-70 family RNA polymerase sigma factor [Dictyobacter kobayashii]GCE19898.1 RNA polymerase sigma factor [Dictyobacter kobayashii]